MWFVVIAVLVVVSLAAYAGYLHRLVRKQNKAQAEAQRVLEEKARVKREEVNQSIQILAQSCGSDQLTLTEASIRIRGLLKSLGVNEEVQQEFSAFYTLADATSHIPFLEDWKMLEKGEKRRLDAERKKLEAQNEEFVMSAAKRIIGRQF